MTKRSKVQTNIGDIFKIPIDDALTGFGQVILKPEKPTLFICVFGATAQRETDANLAEVIRSEIVLAGSTFDALLHIGHWSIVGNTTANLASIALPVYKFGMGDKTFVETLDRSRRRKATVFEERSLPFRTYSAPIMFENAFKAISGVGTWLPDYDDLKYENLKASSRVVV